jgi:hypothetical protein
MSGNHWKKVQPEIVICQKILQGTSLVEIGGEHTPILHTVFAYNFFAFSHFSQQMQNQRKIMLCFDTYIKI